MGNKVSCEVSRWPSWKTGQDLFILGDKSPSYRLPLPTPNSNQQCSCFSNIWFSCAGFSFLIIFAYIKSFQWLFLCLAYHIYRDVLIPVEDFLQEEESVILDSVGEGQRIPRKHDNCDFHVFSLVLESSLRRSTLSKMLKYRKFSFGV